MATYQSLLQTPEWDEKRKSILARDGYQCRQCGIKDVTLHVHHHFYYPNTQPWDYDDEVLVTLCEQCHEREEFNKGFDSLGFRYLLTIGFTRENILRLISVISSRVNVVGKDEGREIETIISKLKDT